MKLFRLAHSDDAQQVARRPLWGCSQHAGLPFIYGFDSFAMAILESPAYRALGRIPYKMAMIQYLIPDYSIHEVDNPINQLYGEPSETNHFLGEWVIDFLRKSDKLLARFPSRHLCEQYNYIVNPRHDLFERIEVIGITPCIYDP